MYDTNVFLSFLSAYTMSFALLKNCPMYGEFPSDARLKMNAREEINFKGEINVFITKIFENYD